PREDQLQALACREEEALDPEAEDRELAGRRIAGARRPEPGGGEDERRDRTPPERARLIVVDEHQDRVIVQPGPERPQHLLAIGRAGTCVQQGYDRGG